jgi:transposase-like protein
MTVMTDNEKQTGPVEDHRSKPRWSANTKMDAVLRLLRGEPLDQLSRELEVEAHRLARDQHVHGAVVEEGTAVYVVNTPIGVVIDAVRCAKLARDRAIGGALIGPSSYFMKSPPEQYPDHEARERTERFIEGAD